MWFIKTIIIFFLILFIIGRFADLQSSKEKRDFKTEILYIAEVILCIVGVVWMFNL